MKANEKSFLTYVRNSLRGAGIRLVFRNAEYVMMDGFRCEGYFNDDSVCIAKRNPRWIEVLAHEYGHFIQWQTGSILYKKCYGPTNNYADIVDLWAKGGDVSRGKVRRAFETFRAMERECERITVMLLKSYGIDFDVERYKQEANCTLYMYHFMETHRIKKYRKSPYKRSILQKMPSSFRASSHTTLPKEIKEILSGYV
jgi:hypothetical protein